MLAERKEGSKRQRGKDKTEGETQHSTSKQARAVHTATDGFLEKIIRFYFKCINVLPTHMHVHHVCAQYLWRPERVSYPLELKFTGSFEPPCGCREHTLVSLARAASGLSCFSSP